MDDASRLIGDLQLKLAHLDDKVAAYRQDMATEFDRYARDILYDVPENLSAEVQRRLRDSLDRYPALGPELRRRLADDASSRPDASVSTRSTNSASSPVSSKTLSAEQLAAAVTKRATPGSPPPDDLPVNLSDDHHLSLLPTPTRERDVELQGLFTPSFLPLFDGARESPQSPASPPRIPGAASAAAAADNETTMGDGLVDGSRPKARNQDQLQSASRASLTPPRPHHQRRATNDTTSSGTSEHSESKMPRSAMRRTSSGSKPPPSPRRVRFEFEGLEVLPTSSPQTSEVSLVQSHSLHSSSSSSPVDPTIADEGEIPISSDALLGPDEDSTPPPKKVSSSQALRALSRTPLDANTIWTVVNAESPEPSSGNNSPRNLASPSPSRTSLQQSQSPLKPVASPKESPQQRAKKSLKSPPPEPDIELNDEDDSSDDDFLAMAKPKSFANKKAILSPITRSPPKAAAPSPEPLSPLPPPAQSATDGSNSNSRRTTPAAKSFKSGVDEDDEDDEEDDFFHFEGGPPSKSRPARPEPIEEEEVEIEDTDPGPQDGPTLYSTSPAVNMPKAQAPLPAHMIAGSVGSYRGRSVHMPVVKDPEVYAQAASMGDMSSFIGGVDGRSGADASDLASYRASVGQVLYSGTPKSLTERMMMEDAVAQRRAAAQGQQP
jgi:hypothetical protein